MSQKGWQKVFLLQRLEVNVVTQKREIPFLLRVQVPYRLRSPCLYTHPSDDQLASAILVSFSEFPSVWTSLNEFFVGSCMKKVGSWYQIRPPNLVLPILLLADIHIRSEIWMFGQEQVELLSWVVGEIDPKLTRYTITFIGILFLRCIRE